MENGFAAVRSERIRILHARAEKRAHRTKDPLRYMREFEDVLNRLVGRGEAEVLGRRTVAWRDPVLIAAEIEALSAYRALKHWGTVWGLYRSYRGRLSQAA